MIKVSTSILASNDRINTIKLLNKTDTDLIHIDSMDNKFVPNYQMPIDEINKIIQYSKKPIDIHLMVENPEEYINNIKGTNINNITIHVENNNVINLINIIKSHNYKVGLAIKPNTNINKLDKYIDLIDILLIMSVEPGFGGQKYIEKTTNKIKKIKNKYKNIIIEVDGGINNETINNINKTADIAVVGSYITNSDNYQERINNIKNS